MCGKFTQMSWSELVELSELTVAPQGAIKTVTPMRFATVLRLGASGRREAVRMRWGFVPASTSDPLTAATRYIHARRSRPFARPFRRRGLIVVHTFNEGKERPPRKTEQYVIAPRNRSATAIAVIWERWAGSPLLETFAMVTVAANALIGTITDRMPAVIDDGDWATWLGEEDAGIDALKAILRPSAIDMGMQPASKSPPPQKPDPQPDLF